MEYTLLSCIDSRVENPRKFYGRFELGPFAPGQGLTVANALRRSLLSELIGTAITLVEINGASHEYETLVGVRESVLDILLNLKQIILTADCDLFTPQVGFLTVKGPSIVCAKDLKLPNGIYSVDPDQYIATVATNGHLNIKFIIASGKNYITHTPNTISDKNWITLLKKNPTNLSLGENLKDLTKTKQNQKTSAQLNESQLKPLMALSQEWKKEKHFLNNKINQTTFSKSHEVLSGNIATTQEFFTQNKKLGYFPIDAIFMPIKSVNYLIESNNHLQLAKDRIILEVWTNGSIHPRHAIHKAAKSLIELFLPLQQIRPSPIEFKSLPNLIIHDALNSFDSTKKKKLTRIDLQKMIYLSKIKQNDVVAKQILTIKKLEQEINTFKQEIKNTPTITNEIDVIKSKIKTIKNEIEIINTLKQASLHYNFDLRILDLDIGNLDLNSQPYRILKQANINTVRDLIFFSKHSLLQFPNLSQRSINQIETTLSNLNLKLS